MVNEQNQVVNGIKQTNIIITSKFDTINNVLKEIINHSEIQLAMDQQDESDRQSVALYGVKKDTDVATDGN